MGLPYTTEITTDIGSEKKRRLESDPYRVSTDGKMIFTTLTEFTCRHGKI
jgi:hypothetical protein